MLDTTIEQPEHRKARHLAALRKIGDRAVALTCAAGDKAQAQLEAQEPEPDAPKAARSPDYCLTFTRLARQVRDTFTLETRIAEGTLARAPAQPGGKSLFTPIKPDRRRPLLQENFRRLVPKTTSNRNALLKAIDAQIETEILNDPGSDIPLGDILGEIAFQFDVEVDPAKLCDEIIGMPPRDLRPPKSNSS